MNDCESTGESPSQTRQEIASPQPHTQVQAPRERTEGTVSPQVPVPCASAAHEWLLRSAPSMLFGVGSKHSHFLVI
jgi:hypothetical protein